MATSNTSTYTKGSLTLKTSYEKALVNQMDDIDPLIESLDNPLHRRIMINFRRHGLLEVSGRYEELLRPDMTVEHPHYRIIEGNQTTILDGMDQVRSFYQSLAEMDMLVMWTKNSKLAVCDWGFAGETKFNQFVPGQLLGDNVFANRGDSQSDTSEYDAQAYYHVQRTLCFNWPYDHGRMAGENVYEDPASKVVRKVNPEDVITGKRAAELLAPIIDKYPLEG